MSKIYFKLCDGKELGSIGQLIRLMPYFLQGSFWDPNLWCEVQSMQNVGDEEHAGL